MASGAASPCYAAGRLVSDITALDANRGEYLHVQEPEMEPVVTAEAPPFRGRNLWPVLWGGRGECSPALLEEAGHDLADQDKGHRGEHGNRMKATGEAHSHD